QADDAGGRGLDLRLDLVGLEDVEDLALLDGVAVAHHPGVERAFGHGDPELRDVDGRGHPQETTLRMAASRTLGPGRQACSSAAENGTGVWGAPTRSTGATRSPRSSSWMRAVISAPTAKRLTDSWTTTARLVLATDSRKVRSSRGAIVRRSTISTSIPSSANAAATPWASRIGLP